MSYRWVSALVGLALFGMAATANATVIDLLGDKDCFGLGGSCPDGTRWVDDLGGVFGANSQVGDPSFTDVWSAPGGVSYTHTYSGGSKGGELEIKIAGIHDINTTTIYNVLIDGALLGIIPVNTSADNFQEVITYKFAVTAAQLDGSSIISFGLLFGDGFSIDYSQLTLFVPEPSTLALFGIGLAGLGFMTRRRRKAGTA